MKIKKKKLLKYIKEWAESSESDAEMHSRKGDYARAYVASVIADFMKNALIGAIDNDFNNE